LSTGHTTKPQQSTAKGKGFNLLDDLISLFYPEACAACGTLLHRNEDTVCLSCRFLLPDTGYEHVADNPVARIFWGRIRFEQVVAIYFFSKKGKMQHLIHELKYKGNRDAGLFLGREMGKRLAGSALFGSIDYLVPVPLHPRRESKRGYNQSEVIARGIVKETGWKLDTTNLIRAGATETQTRKSRSARWDNVKDIFQLQNPERFSGKHVLLIDDVITTGSTLEACALALSGAENIRVSVAAAACATN
jgi:ComF family protein